MQITKRLPDTELEIMKVIWANPSPISTNDIKEILERERPWNIAPLQTLLNRLIERGFLLAGKDGKRKTYVPLVDEESYLAMENKSFLERLNNNSVTKLVASLYNSNSITEDDLEDLRKFISNHTED